MNRKSENKKKDKKDKDKKDKDKKEEYSDQIEQMIKEINDPPKKPCFPPSLSNIIIILLLFIFIIYLIIKL